MISFPPLVCLLLLCGVLRTHGLPRGPVFHVTTTTRRAKGREVPTHAQLERKLIIDPAQPRRYGPCPRDDEILFIAAQQFRFGRCFEFDNVSGVTRPG